MKTTKSLQYHQALQFALVAALPVLIIVILVWLFLLPAMRSDTRIRHQGMARSIAGQVSSHLLGGQRQLAALAHFLESRDALSVRQVTALLDSQCGEGELFETIYISSPGKRVAMAVGLARSRRSIRQDLLGLDLSERIFAMAAGSPEKPVWSETFMSTVSRRLAVALTILLTDNLITAEITLDNLSALISHLPVESGLLTYVIDRQGRIVADSRRLHGGQRFSDLIDAQDGKLPISGLFELDGDSFLGTVVEIDELGWKVLVAQPAANAYQSLRTALKMFALGLTIALMLVLSLSWNRAKRLSKIFQAYGEKAGAIADGRYDETWPSSTITELDQMGQSLKHMARMIDQREKALVENEEQLRNLVSNVPGVVYQYKADPDSLTSARMTYIVREKVIEIFGLDPEAENFHNEFVACLPEQDRSRFEMSIFEAVKAEKPWHYEGPFTKPTGETIWFEGHSVPQQIGDDLIYYGLHADITDRKLAEKALKESEKRLINLTDNVPGVVIQFRTTHDHVYSNEFLSAKTTDIFGLDANSKTILDEFYAHIPDGEKAAYATSMREAIDTVSPWNYEGRFIRPDAETIWFSGHAIPHDDGDTIVYYGILMDITERKRMEESLRQNEELLSNILESMDEALVVFDESLIHRLVNKRYEAHVNKSRKELIGKTLLETFPHFKESLTEKMIYKAMQGEIFSGIESLHTHGDTSYWIRASWCPLRNADGHVIGVVGMGSDITRQKQDQEELRRLRNYLSNIIDSMPSVLVAVDLDGRVTQWNRHTENVTGLSFDQARSQPLADVFPRLAGEMERIQTAIRERRAINSPKVPFKTKQESRFEDVTIFPLIANGVEGAVIRVDDVTERVRLEEMMIQSEKMLSVGGLAAGMAHEVNNPLAGILQNASVLNNRLLGDLPANRKAAEAAGTSMEAIQKYLETRKLPGMIENIRESGTRAAAIVRNMLSFARKSDRRVSSHDLGALLDQTLDLVRTDYDMKKHYDVKQIHIEREYDPLAPPVPCEASKIQQVFMNILKNAAEAMAEVKDAPAPPAFVLRVRNDGTWVRVEIEDNGPGMDESIRRRIFEPFFTTKPTGKGTGLGLPVSYFIVTEDHGGEMVVQPVDGGGTRFVIRLPKGGGDR